MSSREPEVLEQTLRERVETLHDAVRENRVAINAMAAEFGNWRKEPRLRTLIDIMQSEIESQRRAIDKLTREAAGHSEELARLKRSAAPTE